MFFIGVDPGSKSGAIAVVSDSGESPIILPFSEDNLINVCDTYYGHAVLERVTSMPKQGVASTFTFGENYGFIQGVLMAKGVPFQVVLPKVWQKEFGITDKQTSILRAKQLFPGVNLRATERSKVDNHNFADALLMAEWGRRNNV